MTQEQVRVLLCAAARCALHACACHMLLLPVNDQSARLRDQRRTACARVHLHDIRRVKQPMLRAVAVDCTAGGRAEAHAR
jgi:hypothetical protein